MENKEAVLEMVNAYLDENATEEQKGLVDFLAQNESLFSRENMNGHITASAFIIDTVAKEMLLLKHKLYDRYLQPGGHIEADDTSIAEAALREAVEETGISAEGLRSGQLPGSISIPFDIDSHPIPANIKRNETAHVHHDFRYLFLYKGDRKFIIPTSESKDGIWLSYEEAASNPLFTRVIGKVKSMEPFNQ